MKKFIVLLLVMNLLGCSFNYYLQVDNSRNDICYDINSKYKFTNLVMNLYFLEDDHWKLVHSTDPDNIKCNGGTIDSFSYDASYNDVPTASFEFYDDSGGVGEEYYLLTDEGKEHSKECDGVRTFINDEKDGLVFNYNENPMALTILVYDHDKYEDTAENLTSVTFHVYEIDKDDEFKVDGCYAYLTTYQFIE